MNEDIAVALGIFALLVIAFGAGRVIEDFTNQVLMKWIWIGVMCFFALCMAVGMWGYGQSVDIMSTIFGTSKDQEYPAQSSGRDREQPIAPIDTSSN